ncbi:hypothetical protein AMIS_11210 [Actinoplanes missouriensis 431]|uniref:Uncharacterized protein n=1 Tax=Actinoplanes missouriensis (strain ATCC 14538 / DSM 43046 / CBS 188.64 / JCM 3121 / NBRC 102363 / NCIMB 12654 / NRRL B-3342 / UNCC 431) TaxID=512565 RepID=I0H004_ACTM4|nr:hypothetical protein [Actinoplanes missouriensis]BAL86341.1 hypothetical protein AMIS_11210 [Actinoplanes missouriensis 431]
MAVFLILLLGAAISLVTLITLRDRRRTRSLGGLTADTHKAGWIQKTEDI